jgi:hypothetical protein
MASTPATHDQTTSEPTIIEFPKEFNKPLYIQNATIKEYNHHDHHHPQRSAADSLFYNVFSIPGGIAMALGFYGASVFTESYLEARRKPFKSHYTPHHHNNNGPL